ncbi:hypothetical protein FDG2_0444 [Candidatus Protofrankia californiensis]|uniref:Uncharacterized protein n=1 Tax=Candidatus Protofrankia californiensis TaxID=1839754 RepID=A0A1C3NTH7_9ACTN|nr:hypothetical protein FDG2_0444 [Candidatus Protofrankia californiensis]
MFDHSSPTRRQVAALRAGIELLDRIGSAVDATGARLYITSNDHGTYTHVNAMVFGPTDADRGDAGVRVAALHAASDALGSPLTVRYDTPDAFGLRVAVTIDGVSVDVTDHFTGDDIPLARAALTPAVAP